MDDTTAATLEAATTELKSYEPPPLTRFDKLARYAELSIDALRADSVDARQHVKTALDELGREALKD